MGGGGGGGGLVEKAGIVQVLAHFTAHTRYTHTHTHFILNFPAWAKKRLKGLGGAWPLTPYFFFLPKYSFFFLVENNLFCGLGDRKKKGARALFKP